MKTKILITICITLLLQVPLFCQSSQAENEKSAISMVKQIYSTVSREAGGEVDWEEVRSFFVPEATILLRTSLTESTLFTVDGFIADFQKFYGNPGMENRGFKESVLGMDIRVFKDISYIGVLYQAEILDLDRPPSKGIDYWLLMQKEEGWKVLSVANDIVLPGEEIPKTLLSE